MFQIGKTLVSESLIDQDFVCNLKACKGACCVEGEAGAPLSEQEALWLAKNQSKLQPYLPKAGVEALNKQGAFIQLDSGEFETPLVSGKECAYTHFEPDGSAHCGIERAHKAGAVEVQKPISCHLYPVRVQDYSEFSAVNYHRWPICSDACVLGASLKVPVYQFVKDALIRKFGEEWYQELSLVAETHKAQNNKLSQK